MKKLITIAALLLAPALSHATVTNVQTRPSGASGTVQFNNGGVFGSSPTFTYDKTNSDLAVSTVSVTFIDGSTATMRMIRWADGTIQTTAAGSGSYITLTSVLQDGATFFVSSGTVNTLNIGTAIRFPDGSLQITAGGGGGGGGYWIGTATSALNMGGLYAVYGATNVTTSTLTVTGATVSFNGATYVLPSSTSFAGDSKLLVYTLANGTVTASPQSVIIDGMRKSSTDTVTAAKVFQSSVTLPTVAQVTTLDATGEIAVQTNAYTANGSSGTLVFYADGQRYYVVTTTSPIISNSHFPVFNRTTNRWEISASSFTSGGGGGGGSGTPGGSDTQFQFNNASSFGGVVPATYSVTTGQITFSSAVSHVNVSSVTYNNANIVMGTNAKIYWADGTIQVSSPSSSGGGMTAGASYYVQVRDTLQTGATFYVSSATVAGPIYQRGTQGTFVHEFESTSPPYSRNVFASVGELTGGGNYRITASTRPAFITNPATAGQTVLLIQAPSASVDGSIYYYVDGATPLTVGKSLVQMTSMTASGIVSLTGLPGAGVLAVDSALRITTTTAAGGGGGAAGYWVSPATSALNMNGFSISGPSSVTISASGAYNALSVSGTGAPAGGLQSDSGGVVNFGRTGGAAVNSDLLVLQSSVTSAQVGSSMLLLKQNAPTYNDPLFWVIDVSSTSNPVIRLDSHAPDMEVVNLSTDGATGLGKWEPFAMAYQGVNLQVNSRAQNNGTFETVAEWMPLSRGGGLKIAPVTSANGNTQTVQGAPVLFVSTTGAREVGFRAPLNAQASWTWALPSTFANAGQVLYQATDSSPRNLEFSTGGANGSFLMKSSSVPVWSDTIPAARIAAGSLGATVIASSLSATAVQTAVTAGTNVTISNTANGVQISAVGGGAGDIEGVTAGTGLQGGGSSGTVVMNVDPSVVLFTASATVTYLNSTTAGTLYQPLDADLTDLADGSLTGSKVGSGVPAANIAAGSLGASVIASSVAAGAVGAAQMSANTTIGTVGITIDGGGSAITTGVKGYVEVPYSGTIEGWTILGDTSGSIVVDVWKDTYANYPPTDPDSIAGTELPTISAATKGQDLALSSWGTTVTAGDVIGFNVDSATTITRATLVIRIRKS